jgi:hypothetical protein
MAHFTNGLLVVTAWHILTMERTANILNKRSQAANKEQSSNLAV